MSAQGPQQPDAARRGRRPVHRRRGRTRWLLVTPILGLAVLAAGIIALEASGPEVDTQDFAVEEVPALALPDARHCTRHEDDTRALEVMAAFREGGRISSTQVFRCPVAFDGREVTFYGEVVGDVLSRDGGAWVQVNDDAYALHVGPLVGHRGHAGFNSGLSVWLPDGLHERIGTVGRSERRGDVVAIRGTLLRADPDDGGGLTIRAEELEIVAEGRPVRDPLHTGQLIAALLLVPVAIASMVWSRVVARRL